MCENILGIIVASKPNLVDSNLHFIVSKPNLGRQRKRVCVVTAHDQKQQICTCYTHHSFCLLSSVVMETLIVPRLSCGIFGCVRSGFVSVPETVSFS